MIATLPARRRAKDGPHLRSAKISGRFSIRRMPRSPRNGFASAAIGRYGSGLSPPTSSVRMTRMRSGPRARAMASYTVACSSSVGRGAAVHEQELRPQQPDAFAAHLRHPARLVHVADVRDDLHAMPVARDGRLRRRPRAPPRAAARRTPAVARSRLPRPPTARTCSVPASPSRTTRVPGGRSSTRGSMPATAGMPSPRARMATCDVALPIVVQNPRTRVRSSDAASDGARSSATTIESGGTSCGASSRPTSRWSTRRPTSRRSAARPASSSLRSASSRSACCRYACRHAYAAVAPPRMQRGGAVEQLGILEQLLVRREDRAAVGVRLGGEPRLERLELEMRGRDRRVERAALVARIRGPLLEHLVVVAQLEDAADRDAGRGGHALAASRRPRPAGGGAVRRGGAASAARRAGGGPPGRADVRVSAMAATAAPASSPRATTVTVSPPATSSVMMDTTLRAFASRSPFTSRTSDVKRRAAAATAAAGRACNPDFVAITIGRRSARRRPASRRLRQRRRRRRRMDQRVTAARTRPVAAPATLDALHVGHEHGRDQAPRVGRDVVRVERQEQVTGADLVARLHARMEALAVQLHRVEPDVDEDLEPGRGQRERMSGAMHVKHPGVARRDDALVERIERDAVAGQPLREGRVGDLIERDHDAGERREDARRHGGVGSSMSGWFRSPAWSGGGAAPLACSSRRRRSSRLASFFAFRSSSFFRFSKP